jgi:hypothetical protein
VTPASGLFISSDCTLFVSSTAPHLHELVSVSSGHQGADKVLHADPLGVLPTKVVEQYWPGAG